MKEEQLLALIIKARDKIKRLRHNSSICFGLMFFSFVMNRVKDENDADEITVSVFSKVLNKLDLFDPNFQFKTWILTIAQNTIIDFWRRKNRENEDASDGLENVKNEFARSPEELMISEEDQQRIIKIIETMDAKNQDIIRLRFFEEKSIKEIAEELNLSVANTKVRIMRAKKILAELLKEDETDF